MSTSSLVKLAIRSRLAVITLNRPDKKNAINVEMYNVMTRILNELNENDEVSITAITGTGEYYCSGTDLKDSVSMTGNNAIKDSVDLVRKFVNAFISHKKILVAVVNGPALGIAVTTLGLCDIVYCTDNATFQTPFAKLGLSAEGCSSYTFPLIMGPSRANQMLLFNYMMNAKEAKEAGLVARVYSKDQLSSNVWDELAKNASELPYKSLFYSKSMMRRFNESALYEANRIECDRLEERFQSEDLLNAIIKFTSKQRSKI